MKQGKIKPEKPWPAPPCPRCKNRSSLAQPCPPVRAHRFTEALCMDHCRVARNRGFLAGVALSAFLVATVLFVLEILQ